MPLFPSLHLWPDQLTTKKQKKKEKKRAIALNSYGWTGKQAIAVCFKEAEDMEEARTQGEDEW